MATKLHQQGAEDTHRIHDFIFVRELNEVYLLLDHISGRWDKSLYDRHVTGMPHIRDICRIGLMPVESENDRINQAVTLLRAKDMLNAAARPASGLTIAFTLLVIGEEDRRKMLPRWRKLRRNGHQAKAQEAPPADPTELRDIPNASWLGKPTRLTLARYAFPGLVNVAMRFNRNIARIVYGLIFMLAFTCLLSWHVMAGNLILQNLDAVREQRTAIFKEISEAELKFGNGKEGAQALKSRFCTVPVFRTIEEAQLCERRRALDNQLSSTRRNLRQWLAVPKTLYHAVTFWLPLEPQSADLDERRRGNEQLARIVTLVAGTAVLPLCYGILGAGAAVVRTMSSKIRESLLSPRDLNLALLQLALGATVGACIALFVNPSGPAGGNDAGLLGTWALSSSALSFIAGFGVEGVFLALESFVRRVFNIGDQGKRP
ncbi:hypothetical protein [Massilia endophytica]|uniref:hypothetical protein n=1 Tax=Massilia endophytica TaxID=2899220 RepID=UPI001E412A14|nr:hypothetical protein [Massilia endophytica]UGQ48343.1 hypothetical protein LSQ66_07715 [Massilia endophytica]